MKMSAKVLGLDHLTRRPYYRFFDSITAGGSCSTTTDTRQRQQLRSGDTKAKVITAADTAGEKERCIKPMSVHMLRYNFSLIDV